jgi:hypothetical protein
MVNDSKSGALWQNKFGDGYRLLAFFRASRHDSLLPLFLTGFFHSKVDNPSAVFILYNISYFKHFHIKTQSDLVLSLPAWRRQQLCDVKSKTTRTRAERTAKDTGSRVSQEF